MTGLIKRSFSLAGHRTSVALETEFWEVLRDAARTRHRTLGRLVADVDAVRDGSRPLASALRLAALRHASRPGASSELPDRAVGRDP
jgi:predicted DNA-binding ribbon-helix-helix protein